MLIGELQDLRLRTLFFIFDVVVEIVINGLPWVHIAHVFSFTIKSNRISFKHNRFEVEDAEIHEHGLGRTFRAFVIKHAVYFREYTKR